MEKAAIDTNHPMIAQAKATAILEALQNGRSPVRVLSMEAEMSGILLRKFGIPTRLTRGILMDGWGSSVVDITTEAWKGHRSFLESATETDLVAAIVERALDETEHSENDEIWRDRFAARLVRDLGVDESFGLRAIDAPEGPEPWTDRVVDLARTLWAGDEPSPGMEP